MTKPQKKHIKIEHVDRLSRGQRSGAAIGSRAVGHHLRPYERVKYERALKMGYLEVNGNDRENLWNLWEKVCDARKTECWVLVKENAAGKGSIFKNGKLQVHEELDVAKKRIRTDTVKLAKNA